MTRVYLVRHGRAAAGWDVDPDPALDELGRGQAVEVARRLAPLGPLHLVSSPLLRCQQTAFPLGAAWGVGAAIEPAVAEIPSPEGVAMADRVEWLREAMGVNDEGVSVALDLLDQIHGLRRALRHTPP